MSLPLVGSRVIHRDGAQGTIIAKLNDQDSVRVLWDDGTENDWDSEEYAAMLTVSIMSRSHSD